MKELIEWLDAGYRETMGLYEELLVLANTIAESLQAGQWEAVDAQLAKKQAIMDVIDGKEGELGQLRKRVEEELGLKRFSLSALQGKVPTDKLSDTLTQLMDVVLELQKQEKKNEEMLRKLVVGVQDQLEDFGRSKQAAKAYLPGPKHYGEARFVDEKK